MTKCLGYCHNPWAIRESPLRKCWRFVTGRLARGCGRRQGLRGFPSLPDAYPIWMSGAGVSMGASPSPPPIWIPAFAGMTIS